MNPNSPEEERLRAPIHPALKPGEAMKARILGEKPAYDKFKGFRDPSWDERGSIEPEWV